MESHRHISDKLHGRIFNRRSETIPYFFFTETSALLHVPHTLYKRTSLEAVLLIQAALDARCVEIYARIPVREVYNEHFLSYKNARNVRT